MKRLALAAAIMMWVNGCAPKGPVDPCTGEPAPDIRTDGNATTNLESNLRAQFFAENQGLTREEACTRAKAHVARDEVVQSLRANDALMAAQPAGRAYEGALSAAQIDRMTTYAVGIGRAMGCGIPIHSQTAEIASWLNRHVPDSSARAAYVEIVKAGVQANAEMQAAGRSPDSCDAVRRELRLLDLD